MSAAATGNSIFAYDPTAAAGSRGTRSLNGCPRTVATRPDANGSEISNSLPSRGI